MVRQTEIFVYDRQYLISPTTESPKHHPPTIPLPDDFTPEEAPDTLSSPNDLQAWQNLFMKRRAWALGVVEECDTMTASAQKVNGEVTIIRRGVGVAVENLKTHVKSLEQKFGEANTWVEDLVQEHRALAGSCEAALSGLYNLPAGKAFLPFLEVVGFTREGGKVPLGTRTVTTLKDFVKVEDVQKAIHLSLSVAQQFDSRLSEIGINVERIMSDSQSLVGIVDEEVGRPVAGNPDEVGQLMQDIELIAKKVSTDYEHVLGLQVSSKAISQASKLALVHTRDYLPTLKERSHEISQQVRSVSEQKNVSSASAVRQMQTISAIESMLASIHQQLSTLAVDPESTQAFDILSFVDHLPSLYGALLIESVRRREWREKITADSSTLAEEMAMYKEEETRRRKKWLKAMEGRLNPDVVVTSSLAIEVNLRGEEKDWPYVSRENLSTYFEKLKATKGMNRTVENFSQMLKDLDTPNRQQTRRAKAFKNGSVYDVGMGRSSLLLRGDDDLLRSLKDDKSRLEDRLKSSDSRIRKLEDLLHRQSHFNRTMNGNDFQPANTQVLEQQSATPNQPSSISTSRPHETISRRSSVSLRRLSANQGAEDRSLIQRIVILEAELSSEKENSAALRKEALTRAIADQEYKRQLEEAVSTKQDLMGNLEAQQKEFDDGRRFLEDGAGKLNLRLEELEDELARVLGSRDNEKSSTDERVSSLEKELDRARKDAAEKVQKADGQIEYIRNDYTIQREKANKLAKEKELTDGETKNLQERVHILEDQLRIRDNSESEYLTVLQTVHRRLSPDESIPEELAALVESLEYISEQSSTRSRELEQNLSIARTDHDLLNSRLEDIESQLSSTRETLGTKETEIVSMNGCLAEAKAKYNALTSELEDERKQLSTLRTKFAAGETGSEALKERIVEEEGKVAGLSEKLAATESTVQSLEGELSAVHSKLQEAHTTQATTSARLDTRSVQAKELTQKLYTHTERIRGLLEYLGYNVTLENGSTTIQRVPRAVSASTTITDPAWSMNRSLSGPLPTRQSFENATDLSLLHWMHAADPATETSQYATFLSQAGSFDVDAFSETIIKRIKETEHMARKWQKEARAYRDKSHRAASEAHEKIAFRAFKEGDLALFLPTRNQATRPWAAFNVGAPHYFLRETDSHKLRTRDWLLARIAKVEERVVDLSKSLNGLNPNPAAAAGNSERRSLNSDDDGGASIDDENPFELSDGLRWYLLDAAEEKPGAPTTPAGPAKSTVASAHVDARGSIRMKKSKDGNGGASKTLSKSLDSRRSSTNSRKGLPSPAAYLAPNGGGWGGGSGDVSRATTSSGVVLQEGQGPASDSAAAKLAAAALRADDTSTSTDTVTARGNEEVRRDLLWGP